MNTDKYPAFPVSSPCYDHGELGELTGMSLKDWMAGQAMAAMISSGTFDSRPIHRRLWTWFVGDGHRVNSGPMAANVAVVAYQYADAMLQARKEQNGD